MDLKSLEERLKDKAQESATSELVDFFERFSRELATYCDIEAELRISPRAGLFIERDEAEQLVRVRMTVGMAMAALLEGARREYSAKRHQFLVGTVISKAEEILSGTEKAVR